MACHSACEVDADLHAGEGFEVVDLPAVQMASILQRGNLTSSGKTWSALRRWAQEGVQGKGLRPVEVYREVYLVGAPNPDVIWSTQLQQQVTNLPFASDER